MTKTATKSVEEKKVEKFVFDEATHTYYINGKPATGVTSIISVLAKPALIGWAARMAVEYFKENIGWAWEDVEANYGVTREHALKVLDEAKVAHTKKKEAAGEHGTDKHALVEEYINLCIAVNGGKPITVPTLLSLAGVQEFGEWAVKNVKQFLFSERRMFDEELFIAGTADFAYLAKDDKKLMGDFKTSSGIYGIDYWLQVAAYRMLAEGEGDKPYDGMTVVRLGKDGKFEVQSLYDYETYKNAFLSCLTLYRAQAAIKGMVIKGE